MNKKLLKNLDWGVLICSLLLLAIGLIALFSTTQSTGHAEFTKQLQWFAISIPFLIIFTVIDYNKIAKFSPLAYGVFLFLLVIVLFTEEINRSEKLV